MHSNYEEGNNMSANNKKELIQALSIMKTQTNTPASEVWIFEDKVILASIDKGMTEANDGQLIDKGSFAKYINE
jgi:hypothetical protein